MVAATKNKRGRPRKYNYDSIDRTAYQLRHTHRRTANYTYAVHAYIDIIEPYYPEATDLFFKVIADNKTLLRQGVLEQLGRAKEEIFFNDDDESIVIKWAGECINLIKDGAPSKEVEQAVRICRKQYKQMQGGQE